MAYGDDIDATGANHRWTFSGGDFTDQVGSANATNTGMGTTGTQLCEDTTNSAQSNGTTDRITIPDTTDINNSAQTQKAVAGWFRTNAIQLPPKRIWGEGSTGNIFQIVMGFGNNLAYEVDNNGGVIMQVFGPVMQPNRTYHICAIFEGNGFANEVRLYVDGVEQTLADPSDRQPDITSLGSRSPVEIGDPAGTAQLGGATLVMNASVSGFYAQWATWNGTNAALTDTEVREDLFEKGALPDVTISTNTEANMQIALDALADTVRSDAPLCIRVEPVSGGGDLALSADNITFDSAASIHVQYTGIDTLTWTNTNGADASIFSTPNGGTVTPVESVTLTITVLDISDDSAIENARVYIEADTGGPLAAGTEIMNATTNASGVATTTFDYTSDQPIIGRVRKGTSSTYYKTGQIGGPIGSSGLTQTILMIADE